MKIVEFVSLTPSAEELIAYTARVSNPTNQNNEKITNLISYCIDHKHWSIFEIAYMSLQIDTSVAISKQLLRHRSFTFQEFSQRYADVKKLNINLPIPHLRLQDTKNRQNSIDAVDKDLLDKLQKKIEIHNKNSIKLYDELLQNNIAKECARMILPMSTSTRLYMTGNVRSWIHYIQLRTGIETQKEHRDIAWEIKYIFIEKLPIISKALGWA